MSLYVFSTVLLSVIFMLVFSSWWADTDSFKIHLSALLIAATTFLSILLMVAIYPIFNRRTSHSHKQSSLDESSWASEVSNNLSTPAAVIKGYNLVFANKSFLSELGMLSMSDHILGMPITNIIHPGDHQHLAELFAQNTQGVTKIGLKQIRMLCLDGSLLPVHVSFSRLQENNNVDLHLLQFSSTTSNNRKKSNTADLANYQLLINQIEQVLFHLNVNQEIMFLNNSWEDLLDYKIQDSLNKPLLSFVHPEDRPLAEARINSLILGKRSSSNVELRLIGKNGDLHWMEFRAKNTSKSKGERSSVIGTLTDIGQMKVTETSLRNNRRLLSTLLNSTPGMIYRCKNDMNWSFEYVSDGCVEVTGYEPYEMINSPNFSWMQIIHQEDRNKTWDAVQNKISQQQKFEMVYRIVTRSGTIKWVWEQGKGIFSSAGDLLALEGYITNISKQDDLELLVNFQKLFQSE